MAAPPGFLGLGVVMIYFAVNQDWGLVVLLGEVGVAGLVQYILAKYWLRSIENRDLREWQRENPTGEPSSRDD